MFSSPQVRPSKRRIDEIDQKIECLSKVIDTMTGLDKSFMERKLLTVKLKKQKLLALSLFAQTQAVQKILADYDILVLDNELNVEIESIRNSKKFKRSEKSMRSENRNSRREDASTPVRSAADATDANSLYTQKIPEDVAVMISNITMEYISKFCYKTRNEVLPTKSNNTESAHEREQNMQLDQENESEPLPSTSQRDPFEIIPTEPYMSSVQKDLTKIVNVEMANTSDDHTHEEPSSSAVAKRESKIKSRDKKHHQSRKSKNSITYSSANTETQKENFVQAPIVDIQTQTILDESSSSQENIEDLSRTFKKIYSEITATTRAALCQSPDLQTNTNNYNKGNSQSSDTSHEDPQMYVDVYNNSRMSTGNETFTEMAENPGSEDIGKARNSRSKTKTTKKLHKRSKAERMEKISFEETTQAQPGQSTTSVQIEVHDLNGNVRNDVRLDENSIFYLTELVMKAIEKNAVRTNSNEDIVNDLFKDLMASKHIKLDSDISSEKTSSCFQCGLVSEGHMCAYTIRELLEKC